MASGADLPDLGFEPVPLSTPEAADNTFYQDESPAPTPEAGVRMATTAWSRRIARSTFAQFVREFFDGKYRERLAALAPSTAVSFTTLPGDTFTNADRERRYIQVAQKVARLWQKLPCILVTDTGETINASGLGYYDRVQQVGDDVIRTRSRVFQVPLEIVVASRDEDSADELAEVVGVVIENRNVVGSLIQGANFEVRLPTTYSPGPRSTPVLEGDPTQTFAMVSINAEVGVEVWWYEKSKAIKVNLVSAGRCIDPTIPPTRPAIAPIFMGFGPRAAAYPKRVRLSDMPTIRLSGYPGGVTVFSRDINVLMVSDTLKILPQRVGHSAFVVRGPNNEILDEYHVEVTL